MQMCKGWRVLRYQILAKCYCRSYWCADYTKQFIGLLCVSFLKDIFACSDAGSCKRGIRGEWTTHDVEVPRPIDPGRRGDTDRAPHEATDESTQGGQAEDQRAALPLHAGPVLHATRGTQRWRTGQRWGQSVSLRCCSPCCLIWVHAGLGHSVLFSAFFPKELCCYVGDFCMRVFNLLMVIHFNYCISEYRVYNMVKSV